MKVVVLTTDTRHHRHFVHQILADSSTEMSLAAVFVETRNYPWRSKARKHLATSLPNVWKGGALNPYVISPLQKRRQDRYEKAQFPDEHQARWPEVRRHSFFSLNDSIVVSKLEELHPDLLFVYGTGILTGPILKVAPLAVNAHGGRLPHYRGLDTNLWAALQGHPQDMAVTFHGLVEKVDSGPIYLMESLPRPADLSLTSLRFHTTILCTQMFKTLVASYLANELSPLVVKGPSRYYDPMPALLKRRADHVLKRYARANLVS